MKRKPDKPGLSCPHCGHRWSAVEPIRLALTPQQWQIYCMVAQRPRSSLAIADVLYGQWRGTERTVMTQISLTNKRLAAFGQRIRCLSGIYHLVTDDSAALETPREGAGLATAAE